MVAVIRWRGFTIDIEGMKAARDRAQAIVDTSPVNINKPSEVRAYMLEVMDDIESLNTIQESTKKQNLEVVANYQVKTSQELLEELEEDEDKELTLGVEHWERIKDPEHCLKCDGTGELFDGTICKRCNGKGRLEAGQVHPAAERAKKLLEIKYAAKERELFNKLIFAGTLNALAVCQRLLSGMKMAC